MAETNTNTIVAEPRELRGKGGARTTRRAGRVPAVIYGNKQDPVLISVDPRALHRELCKPAFFTRMFDLKVKGETHRVLAREMQLDPVTDTPIHVDFLRVSAETQIHVAVPVRFENEELSPGLKRGGVLNVVRHEIEVICAAGKIPSVLVIDLTDLEIGDSAHINMVDLPEGVQPAIADRDFTIASVAAPTVVREEAAEEQVALAAAELEEAEAEAVEGEVEGEEAEAEAPAEAKKAPEKTTKP